MIKPKDFDASKKYPVLCISIQDQVLSRQINGIHQMIIGL
jgi:hypothetical protein